jgi:hypothetical protein
MRKIFVSALILFVLIGLMLPASAGSFEKKKCFEKCEKPKFEKPLCCEKPNIDTDINTAVVTQTQIAVPISVGDWNSAWFGDAGTQSTYQSQYSSIDQENE